MKRVLSIAIILCLMFSMVACGSDTGDQASPSPEAQNNTEGDNNNTGTGITETETLKIGKADYAAHGTKGFCVAVAVVQGDTIVQAIVDDYQVMSKTDATCVPNSDGDFGNYFADTTSSLASKRTNSDYYSGLMKSSANATISIDKNLDAVADYAIGKTVSELEDLCNQKSTEEMVDAVSGSTLADTRGYLLAIVEAAKDAVSGDNTQDNGEITDDTNGNNNPSGVDSNNTDLSNGATDDANGTNGTGTGTGTGDDATATDNANGTTDNANGDVTTSPGTDTNSNTDSGTGNTTTR